MKTQEQVMNKSHVDALRLIFTPSGMNKFQNSNASSESALSVIYRTLRRPFETMELWVSFRKPCHGAGILRNYDASGVVQATMK